MADGDIGPRHHRKDPEISIRSEFLCEEMQDYLRQLYQVHPDESIRELSGEQYSYAKDYEVIKSLKAFADKHGICFLIVHHTTAIEKTVTAVTTDTELWALNCRILIRNRER